MDTDDLAALRDRLISQVPLCPAAFVTAYIRQAATTFFQESEVWRYTFEDIDIVENQTAYTLTFPSAMTTGVEVRRIDYAKYSGGVVAADTYSLDYYGDGEEEETFSYYLVFDAAYVPTESITISSYAAWDATETYDEDDTVKYGKLYWTSLQDTNLNQNPITETDYWERAEPTKGLDVWAVLNPAIVSGYVTPRLWLQWADALLWGAKVAIYSAATRPWYDEVSLVTAQTQYAVQLARARSELTQQFAYDGALRATNSRGWL